MGSTAAHAVNTALKYIGTIENPIGSNRTIFGERYGWNGVAWCDIFFSEMIREASGSYTIAGGKFSYTVSHAQQFIRMGRWGNTPRLGAAVFFDWGGSKQVGNIDHIGMVRGNATSSGLVPTVEGNTSYSTTSGGRVIDGVAAKLRSPAYIVGYGYPLYSSTTTTPTPVGTTVSGVFPLPRGHWFGTNDGSNYSHSGIGAADDANVRRIQREVKATVDGDFGPATRLAVINWQKAHLSLLADRTADGKVGPNTWSAMARY